MLENIRSWAKALYLLYIFFFKSTIPFPLLHLSMTPAFIATHVQICFLNNFELKIFQTPQSYKLNTYNSHLP